MSRSELSRLAVDGEVGEPIEEPFQGDTRLEPGDSSAEAVVGSVAEAEYP